MKTEAHTLVSTPDSLTRTRSSGIPVELIGRKSAYTVWAKRLTDGAVRDYWHSELMHAGGANPMLAEIQVLPIMRRKTAEDKAKGQQAREAGV